MGGGEEGEESWKSLRVVAAPGPLRGPIGRRVADLAAAVTRRRTAYVRAADDDALLVGHSAHSPNKYFRTCIN